MENSKSWFLPLVLAASAAVALWWLFKPDSLGRTGLRKLSSRPPADPFAAIGTAACEAGTAYYGGVAAGVGAAPLCTGIGGALAPGLHAASNLLVDSLDAQGQVVRAAGSGVSGAVRSAGGVVQTVIDAHGKVLVAGETVASDAYKGTKTVLSDTYNAGKAIVSAPVKLVDKLFGGSSSKVCRASNGKDVFPNDMVECSKRGITDCNSCGDTFYNLAQKKWAWQ